MNTGPLSAEMRDLLALTLVPGLGPKLTSALLEHFGSATVARAATASELRELPHIGEKLAESFARAMRAVDVDAEMERLVRYGVSVVSRRQADYPAALQEIFDPPHLLYYRGSLEASDASAVAIVGSRQCTSYGKRTTERLAAGLARAGFTVISGLARGIDAAAHQGALDAGGRTLAVLAGGLSSIYPPEHVELSKAVEKSGALLTETPMAMSPQRGMFHARNRLISGLARAVVIVEANDRSGALITARHACEQGREVFAVPANVDSATSAGSLKLLRQGVRLIRDVDDLLEDLNGIPAPPQTQGVLAFESEIAPVEASVPDGLNPTERQIWEMLHEAVAIDRIAAGLVLPINELSRLLMTLELKKVVRRLPGNLYERR